MDGWIDSKICGEHFYPLISPRVCNPQVSGSLL